MKRLVALVSGITWNILPPGQTGGLPPDSFGTNQLKLYDDLAPLFGDVGPGDIRRLFKSARFFAPAGGEVTRPRRGLTIRRDRRWGVPHIRGRTRSDVFFGIGWATDHPLSGAAGDRRRPRPERARHRHVSAQLRPERPDRALHPPAAPADRRQGPGGPPVPEGRERLYGGHQRLLPQDRQRGEAVDAGRRGGGDRPAGAGVRRRRR